MSERVGDLALAVSNFDSIWGKVISSASLLGKDRSIIIVHDGQRYVLSITKLGKLILTK